MIFRVTYEIEMPSFRQLVIAIDKGELFACLSDADIVNIKWADFEMKKSDYIDLCPILLRMGKQEARRQI